MSKQIISKQILLADLFSEFSDLPTIFKNRVLKECSWSSFRFHRLVRERKELSNAEAEKIKAIALETAEEFLIYCRKCSRS